MFYHDYLPICPRLVDPPRCPRSTGAYDCEVPLPVLPTSSSVVLVPVVQQAVRHTYNNRMCSTTILNEKTNYEYGTQYKMHNTFNK